MTIEINRKVYEFACDLLIKYKEDNEINLKDECRKFKDTNNKDRKKIVSLVINYLNNKDDIKKFKKDNKIKCKKNNLNDKLIRLMLTEILYSPCFKDDTFNNWKEWNYLNNFNEQINNKKKTIKLRELPIKQIKRKNDEIDTNNQQQNQQQQNNQQQSAKSIKNDKRKKQKLLNDQLDLFKDIKDLPVKYLRINKIKTTIDDIVYELVNELEFIQVGRKFDCFTDYLKKLFNLNDNEFMLDYHFPDDLIVINKNCKKEFQSYRMYENGKIIFQDKASLIPLKCVNLTEGMNIADICCCPGMKTFGISSYLKNNCNIISIDIDSERIEMMKGLMDKLGVNCTKIIEKDFTEATIDDFKFNNGNQIDVLFLDPSCSGSGMVDKRNDQFEEQQNKLNSTEDRKRLMSLASFQTKLLSHAMSLKPSFIVYSTCSFSIWENEFVICKTQEQANDAKSYELIEAFPDWLQRGDKNFTCSKYVCRSGPNRGTRGFFTAVFKRK